MDDASSFHSSQVAESTLTGGQSTWTAVRPKLQKLRERRFVLLTVAAAVIVPVVLVCMYYLGTIGAAPEQLGATRVVLWCVGAVQIAGLAYLAWLFTGWALNESKQEFKLKDTIAKLEDRIRRRNHALYKSQKIYQDLLKQLDVMVYRYDLGDKAGMSFVSDRALALTGYEAGALSGAHALDFEKLILPTERQWAQGEINNQIQRSGYFDVSYRIRHANGQERWVRDKGRGIKKNEEWVAREGMVSDVTEQHVIQEHTEKLQRDLMASRSVLHSAIDALEAHVLVLDNQARVFMANQTWLGHAVAQGSTREREQEWIGLNYFELAEAADATQTRAIHSAIREIMAGQRRSFHAEVAVPVRGATQWMHFTATVLQGEWQGVLIARQPITERKLAQNDNRQLRSYLDTVLENSPEHGMALANMARQIVWFNTAAQRTFGRNKVEIMGHGLESVHPDVQNAVQQLQKDLRLPNPSYEHRFESSHFPGLPGQHFECRIGLVRDADGAQQGYLLSTQQTRPATPDGSKVQRVAFALNGVLDNLPVLFDAQIGERSIALIVEVDADVPEYVEGDPVLLTQIIHSLVGNAIEYTQQGEVCVRVHRIAATEPQVNLAFEISDTGAGIAPAQLNHVFQAHPQSGLTTTKRLPGAGLILPVCRRLAQLMGGDISVRSELGKGSAFTFTLPLGPA